MSNRPHRIVRGDFLPCDLIHFEFSIPLGIPGRARCDDLEIVFYDFIFYAQHTKLWRRSARSLAIFRSLTFLSYVSGLRQGSSTYFHQFQRFSRKSLCLEQGSWPAWEVDAVNA